MKKILCFTFLCGIVLSSCALNSNQGISNLQPEKAVLKPKYTAENLQITLEKTPCYGMCPTYSLKIYGDGKVVWDGTKNVKKEAQDSAMISQDEIVKLVNSFDVNNFYSFNDRYESRMVTDLPSTTVTIVKNGERKSVYSYFGAPKEFTNVARAIEDIAIAQGWLERN
ncbi:MAG: DUF6438 domain-containing protein [Bacteroidota bacterium]